MAPRRGNSGFGGAPLQDIHNLPLDTDTIENGNLTHCCVPNGECLRGKQPIRLDQIHEAVKVSCNNDNCTAGNFMHRECFDHWEQSVLTYLKNCGRARSWSDRQRQQNLWTKKGYDLAYKACACQCERGHLRKDLDWNPTVLTGLTVKEDELTKKKKKKNRANAKPTLSISALHNNNTTIIPSNVDGRGRTGSLSSSNGSSSLPDSGLSVSPIHTLSSTGAKRKIRFDQIGDSR
ncbi:hypothetical protein M8J75_014017 [Diaphorina citri]|nr:hypothetical protein M8J75_014017 [Diaphorina citri]KAI5739347.1 hypothetical protein M8J77_018124 [Diaphorina citri]